MFGSKICNFAKHNWCCDVFLGSSQLSVCIWVGTANSDMWMLLHSSHGLLWVWLHVVAGKHYGTYSFWCTCQCLAVPYRDERMPHICLHLIFLFFAYLIACMSQEFPGSTTSPQFPYLPHLAWEVCLLYLVKLLYGLHVSNSAATSCSRFCPCLPCVCT